MMSCITKMLTIANCFQSQTVWNNSTRSFHWQSTGLKGSTIANPKEWEQEIRLLSGKEANKNKIGSDAVIFALFIV